MSDRTAKSRNPLSKLVTNFLGLFGKSSKKTAPKTVDPKDPVDSKDLVDLVDPKDPVDPPPPQSPLKTPPETPPETPKISPERTTFLDRLGKLQLSLQQMEGRLAKLTLPDAVTLAAKAAADQSLAAAKAGEARPEDWLLATTALDTLESRIGAAGTACVDAATAAAAAFDVRYKAKDRGKPAGKDIVAKYIDYGKARKSLAQLIAAKDGIAALEAGPATEIALKAFEAAAAPSPKVKAATASKALKELEKLTDEELDKKSLKDKAELALELCANGALTGSKNGLPVPGGPLDQLCRLYKNSKPDPKFMDKRAKQREAIADEVAGIDEIKKLYKSDGTLDAEHWKTLTEDSDKTLALMQKICDVQAKAMGMPEIKVFKDPDPPLENGTMGGYNPARNDIGLNFFPGYLQPVSEAIDTIIHETFHAHQDIIVRQLKAGEIGPGDDEYATALMYMVNDIPVGYVFDEKVGSVNYKTQPTEFDSFHHAEKTVVTLLEKVKTAAAGPTS